MNLYAIYGVSGCGRGVMPVVRRMLGRECNGPHELVFIDDNPPAQEVNGHPVVTYRQFLETEAEVKRACIAIADSAVRARLAERCTGDGIEPFTVIADNVVIMDANQIGEGAILSPFVTITSNVRIGRHFQANLYAYVEHDCVIGDFVTLAPGVKCNGNVVIEDHAYIGSGAILRQGKPGDPLVIGRGAVVGMGAVVTRSVPPGLTVGGNPARDMTR